MSDDALESVPDTDTSASAPSASTPSASTQAEPGLRDYTTATLALGAFGAALFAIVRQGSGVAMRPTALIAPMVALFALTALVWLGMVLARNIAIFLGRASVRYYVAYSSQPPSEQLERPARTFNNLMQVPTLFYALCVLMVSTAFVDRAQLSLAWAYVAARTLHAIVYIGWNRVPVRFTCWLASCIVLGVMWTRFALQSAASW